MLNSKEGFESTLSLHVEMFPDKKLSEEYGINELSFFTDTERAEIRARIQDYELTRNPRSRNGGSTLIKKIKNVAIAKRDLLKFINDIHELLKPKERSRISIQEAEVLTEQRSINKTADSYRKAFPNEKMLRSFADNILGEDIHQDYTFEELPVVIATKQITGELIPINM